MRTIEHSTEIHAPPAAVWRILSDTPSYGHWNPFMTQLDGLLRVGERLTLTVRPGKRRMTFRPTVLAVEDGTLIRWRGRLAVRGVFDGEHELRIAPAADGGSRFTQRETFTGVLVPLMRRVLDDTDAGFRAMNEALKTRATTGDAGPTDPNQR